MRLASIDGTIRAAHEAHISVFDRGLLFGDSVFETLRTYGGRVFEVEAHLARLERSLAAVGIQSPCSRATFKVEIVRALEAAGNEESVLRVIVTRGEGPLGIDPSEARRPSRILTVEALTPQPVERLRHGLRTRTLRTIRAADAAPSAKLTNYLASVLATREVRALGADEALIVGSTGHVLEGTTFNVFAVVGQSLCTAPVELGLLEGITRGLVLDLGHRAGLTIELRALTPEELGSADEVFATSTLRELVPIATVDEHRIAKTPGPWTRRLHEAFCQRAGASPPPYDNV